MLRGNHETRAMTETFTFRKEVLAKYDEETYQAFMELFDSMPVAALVAEKYLAVHGGISPKLEKIQSINMDINRFMEVPFEGLFCDLMWADPTPDKEADLVEEYSSNCERDCSVYFGRLATKKLLE